MRLELKRIYTCNDYTIGHLYVNGKYVCDTIEDTDRRISDAMSAEQVRIIKVAGKTAIPWGKYKVTMSVQSPKYSQVPYYKRFCNGFLPRLRDVKGFEGILIHKGNTEADTSGCVLVGWNRVKGRVVSSTIAWETLMRDYLQPAKHRGEEITITVWAAYDSNSYKYMEGGV